MIKFLLAYLLGVLIGCAILCVMGYSFSYAQPQWLLSSSSAIPPATAAALAPPAGVSRAIIKAVERVRHDTITVVRIDTIVRIDTLQPPKPIYYNYIIYYEIVQKKLALKKGFEWDYSNTAQKTQMQSSDTTLLNLGNESLREASYTYDDKGNKTQTYEKIIEGLDMRVIGNNVNITYRTGVNLLVLNGKFDINGLLMLSSDFSRRRYFLFFIPIDFLFGSEKYTLFLRLEKSEVIL